MAGEAQEEAHGSPDSCHNGTEVVHQVLSCGDDIVICVVCHKPASVGIRPDSSCRHRVDTVLLDTAGLHALAVRRAQSIGQRWPKGAIHALGVRSGLAWWELVPHIRLKRGTSS